MGQVGADHKIHRYADPEHERRGQEPAAHTKETAQHQQALPGIDYLMQEEGIERWILLGTDYVYPHVTNEIVAAYLASKGVAEEAVTVSYTPFGHRDWMMPGENSQLC